MATGRVIGWKAGKGYGFIRPDAEGPDVFLHVAELDGVQPYKIRDGVRVEYRPGQGERGPKACGVSLAGESRPAPRDEEMADFLPADAYGREVAAIMDEASRKIQHLARQHGWVE